MKRKVVCAINEYSLTDAEICSIKKRMGIWRAGNLIGEWIEKEINGFGDYVEYFRTETIFFSITGYISIEIYCHGHDVRKVFKKIEESVNSYIKFLSLFGYVPPLTDGKRRKK